MENKRILLLIVVVILMSGCSDRSSVLHNSLEFTDESTISSFSESLLETTVKEFTTNNIPPIYDDPTEEKTVELNGTESALQKIAKNIWNAHVTDRWYSPRGDSAYLIETDTDGFSVYIFQTPRTQFTPYFYLLSYEGEILYKELYLCELAGIYQKDDYFVVGIVRKEKANWGLQTFVYYNPSTGDFYFERKYDVSLIYGFDGDLEEINNHYSVVEDNTTYLTHEDFEKYIGQMTPIDNSRLKKLEIPYENFRDAETLEKIINILTISE